MDISVISTKVKLAISLHKKKYIITYAVSIDYSERRQLPVIVQQGLATSVFLLIHCPKCTLIPKIFVFKNFPLQ